MELSRLPGGVNEIGVVEPGHALAGSGSVSAENKVAGSLGFVGGQEEMKPDAIVKAWLRSRGVYMDQRRQRVKVRLTCSAYVERTAPCASFPNRRVDPRRVACFG